MGGGLEGQRDQYMAKRKGAQAHLAQLDEFLGSRDRAQAFLLHLEDILEDEDEPPDVVSVLCYQYYPRSYPYFLRVIHSCVQSYCFPYLYCQ